VIDWARVVTTTVLDADGHARLVPVRECIGSREVGLEDRISRMGGTLVGVGGVRIRVLPDVLSLVVANDDDGVLSAGQRYSPP